VFLLTGLHLGDQNTGQGKEFGGMYEAGSPDSSHVGVLNAIDRMGLYMSLYNNHTEIDHG